MKNNSSSNQLKKQTSPDKDSKFSKQASIKMLNKKDKSPKKLVFPLSLSLSTKPKTREIKKFDNIQVPEVRRSINASRQYTQGLKDFPDVNDCSRRVMTEIDDGSTRLPVALKTTDYIKNLLKKEIKMIKLKSKSKKKAIKVKNIFNTNINIQISDKMLPEKRKFMKKPGELKEIEKDKKKEIKLTKQALIKGLKKVKQNQMISETPETGSKKEEKPSISMMTEDSLFKIKNKKRDTSSKNRSRSLKLSEGSSEKGKPLRFDNEESLCISKFEGYLLIS